MGRALSASSTPRVSVVLVTWNSAPFLRRCLSGILHQDEPDLEVIHVDNASTDDSIAIVRNALLGAPQIRNETNRGFAGAVNQGIRASTGRFVFLCNPDAFLEPHYVRCLAEALDEAGDRFGMATGKLFRASGNDIVPTDIIDTKGIRMTRAGRHFDIGQGKRDGEDDRGIRALSLPAAEAATPPQNPATAPPLYEVFGVSGATAMYRRSFIEDVSVGGEFLDEDFFTYREDADVAWRGQVLGWRALYVPDAVGYHVRTVTPNARRELSARANRDSVKNRFLLRLKNEGLYLALRNLPFELTRDVIAVVAVLTIERSSMPALTWLWNNRQKVMTKRRVIQRRRRRSDRELASWFR